MLYECFKCNFFFGLISSDWFFENTTLNIWISSICSRTHAESLGLDDVNVYFGAEALQNQSCTTCIIKSGNDQHQRREIIRSKAFRCLRRKKKKHHQKCLLLHHMTSSRPNNKLLKINVSIADKRETWTYCNSSGLKWHLTTKPERIRHTGSQPSPGGDTDPRVFAGCLKGKYMLCPPPPPPPKCSCACWSKHRGGI